MQLALDDFTKTLRQHGGVPSTDALLYGGAPSSIASDSAAAPAGAAPYTPSRLGALRRPAHFGVFPCSVPAR
jgi:hypothetical protein